jgi:threonine/homoserine/homoserine lactone efflux protein
MNWYYTLLAIAIVVNFIILLLEYSERIGTVGVIRAYYDERIGKGWLTIICAVVLLLFSLYID